MGNPEPSEKNAAAAAKPKAATKAKTTAPSVKKTVVKTAATKAVESIKPADPKKAAPTPLPPPAAPSSDDIGLRAYFISEKRHQLGLPGDSSQDWVEAERQLVEETKAKKPLRKKTTA